MKDVMVRELQTEIQDDIDLMFHQADRIERELHSEFHAGQIRWLANRMANILRLKDTGYKKRLGVTENDKD